MVDTERERERDARNHARPGAAYFNQLGYAHCLAGESLPLLYTHREIMIVPNSIPLLRLFFPRRGQSVRDNNVAPRSKDYANRVLFFLRLCSPPSQEGVKTSRIASSLLSRDILFLFAPKRSVVRKKRREGKFRCCCTPPSRVVRADARVKRGLEREKERRRGGKGMEWRRRSGGD